MDDDWARPSGDQIEKCKRKVNPQTNFKNGASQWKISIPNWKLTQAIFLPGAWGKIPVFMGKNHPTPGAAMAFFMLKTTPLKPDFSESLQSG